MPLHSFQRGERLEVLEQVEIDVVDRRCFEVTVSCRHASNPTPRHGARANLQLSARAGRDDQSLDLLPRRTLRDPFDRAGFDP